MIQLKNVDLNLMVVLDVLLRTQSVTRAAEELHRTPSAISHSLGRLRELFADELLVRDGRRMRPTARGVSLAESLPRQLEQLSRTITASEAFDPTTTHRTFRVAAPDFVATVLATLIQRFARDAPGALVELREVGDSALRDLAEGRFDALISPSNMVDEGLREQPLGASYWRVFGRKGHPAFADWSVETWQKFGHLRVQTTPIPKVGPVDRAVDALRLNRHVAAVIPNFAMAPSVLARTDHLLTVPSMAMDDRIVDALLDRRDVPFELPAMPMSLYRSAISGNTPAIQWFLDQINHAMEDLLHGSFDPT
ncbi:MAG: LysR substrate-binding domain-containing protein [Myxococcota bacterium]